MHVIEYSKDLSEENMVEISSVYSTPSLPVNKEDIASREDVHPWPHLNGAEVPAIDAEIKHYGL